MRKPRFRPRFEGLEGRFAPAVYTVAPGGSNVAAGSADAPWQTLQYAAGRVAAGDTVVVRPGDYAGFDLWTGGTAAAPITFRAEPGARIVSPNPRTPDGINLEAASWVTIEGFTVVNQPRAGIRSVLNDHVVIRGNTADNNGRWGIFTGFADDVLIENNVASRSQAEHGVYVSNSGDRPVVRGNTLWGNYACGLHMNGDASQGGDGVISGALVENNVITDNGRGGGSSINADGVQNSVFRNNLITNAHASGISLYRIDGGAGSTGNLLVNNTVLVAADGRWAVNIRDDSIGNTLRNNVLYNSHSYRGSLSVWADSLSGLVSDYNVVMDRFTLDDGDSVLSLAGWLSVTGQDAHSVVATPGELFVNAAGGDYQLRAGSPAIDRGTATGAPPTDYEGQPRPQGAGYDIGHDEFASTLPPPPPPAMGALEFASASYSATEGVGSVTVTVNRVGGSSGAVSVQFATADVTAAAGSDYGSAFGTLTWADGDAAPKTLTVAVLDDAVVEPNETVTLALTGPTGGAVLGASASATLNIADNDVLPPPPPPPPPGPPKTPPGKGKKSLVGQFAVGTDDGAGGLVQVFNPDLSEQSRLTPFPDFTGSVRTAVADFTGDGVADTAAAAGPGGAPWVKVYDGATGSVVFETFAFEAGFAGGVYVAAGDVTSDGVADLVLTPDEGGGPRVRVLRGGDFAPVADFFGIDDPNFRGGARAALGDLTGDGVGDLVVSAGFGGGPRVTLWDGGSVRDGSPAAAANFFAFETALRNGAFVTAGDVTGDGIADLIFGGGPGGGPRVRVFDGRRVLAAGPFGDVEQLADDAQVANFFGGDPANRNGVRLAAKDLDGDDRADLVVAAASRVTGYLGRDLVTGAASAEFELDTVPGGVYVG